MEVSLEVEMYWRMASVILQKKYRTVPTTVIADALAICIWEASGILEVARKNGKWWFQVVEGFDAPWAKIEISSEIYRKTNARVQKANANAQTHRPW